MKRFVSLTVLLVLVGCTSNSVSQTAQQTSSVSTSSMQSESSFESTMSEFSSIESSSADTTVGYKDTLYGGLIPSTWSMAALGDIGPMPMPDSSAVYLDPRYISYSFASGVVMYGDTSWEQVDFYLMDPKDMKALVARWKNDANFSSLVKEWSTQTIDGHTADVVELKTEPDGTIDKGATGGKMYFIYPGSGSGDVLSTGLIIDKQAKGSPAFESAFDHYLQTINFAQGD